jgi:hypothetical protein
MGYFSGVAGWRILPPLVDVSVTLDGPNYASGSYSQISITLKTVQECDSLRIVFPTDFSLESFHYEFVRIVRNMPVDIGVRSALLPIRNDVTIIAFEKLPRETEIVLKMKNVLLGIQNPGPVAIDIYTFLDGKPMDRFKGFDAFILASRISVISQALSSRDRDIAVAHEAVTSGFDAAVATTVAELTTTTTSSSTLPSVIPLLTAWTGGLGFASLNMTFTGIVYPGEIFFISSVWYGFDGIDKSRVNVMDVFTGEQPGVNHITTSSNNLMFSVESRIDVGAVVQVEFPTKIPEFSNKREISI